MEGSGPDLVDDARKLRLLAWRDALRSVEARKLMLRRQAVAIGAGIAGLYLTLVFPRALVLFGTIVRARLSAFIKSCQALCSPAASWWSHGYLLGSGC